MSVKPPSGALLSGRAHRLGDSRSLVGLLCFVLAALLSRPLWRSAPPDGLLVQLRTSEGEALRLFEGAHDGQAIVEGDRIVIVGASRTVEHAARGLLWAEPLDLNHASAPELRLLSGIGEVIAKRIVADRERRGPFRALHDLTRVHGVGPKTVARVAPYVLSAEVDQERD